MADIEVNKDQHLETEYPGLEDMLQEPPLPTASVVEDLLFGSGYRKGGDADGGYFFGPVIFPVSCFPGRRCERSERRVIFISPDDYQAYQTVFVVISLMMSGV